MSNGSKVKSQVTQDKIETDEETFVKVAPDQTCTQPLIPTKDPSKEIDFDVTLEKGVVYNPSKRVGIYGKTVSIGYGGRINSSIYGREKVELSSGIGEMGPGMVYGNVNSLNKVVIDEPTKKMDDYGEGSLTIVGDIAGNNIEINSPLVVRGNIIADQDIEINAMTVVEGNIYSKKGRVSLSDTVCNLIVGGNYEDEESNSERLPYALDLKEGVSVLTPLIWIKNTQNKEDINVRSPVRVISSVCWDCDRVKSKLKCKRFLDGNCDKFDDLTSKDKIKRKQGMILSNTWRRIRQDQEEFIPPKKTLQEATEERKKEDKYQELFEADEYDEYATLEDMTPEIEQSIEQTVLQSKGAAEEYKKAEVKKQKVKSRAERDKASMKESTKRFKLSLDAQLKDEVED